jgi:protein TonB
VSTAKKGWLRWFPALAGVLVFSVVGGLIFLLIQWAGSQPETSKKTVQQITVIAPPPPPPPPPVQEEPPPPEMEEEVVEEPDPAPDDVPDLADQAPPGEQLGIDADGTGAGDAFGLVGKKGGRGLLSGGDPYQWYSQALQQRLFERLNDEHEIRRAAYSIIVHLWIAQDGAVDRFELAKGSGNQRLDEKIALALASIEELAPPVPGLPQPVKVKLTARL